MKINSRKQLLVLLGLISFITAAPQPLQFSFNSSVGQTDNILNTYYGNDMTFWNSAFSLAQQPAANTRYYFEFSHREIVAENDYDFTTAETGWQFRWLEIPRNQFFAGAVLSGSLYAPRYEYFDNTVFRAYGDWKVFVKSQRSIGAGYSLNRFYYPNLYQADNWEHSVYGKTNLSFPTRTSVKLEGWWAAQDFLPDPEVNNAELNTNYLAGAELRVSQSLTKLIGAAVTVAGQQRLNRVPDDVPVTDLVTSPFVDRYRRDEASFAGSINILLPAGIKMSTGAYLATSYYLDVPVYEFDFGTETYVLDGENYIMLDDHRVSRYQYYSINLSRDWFPRQLAQIASLNTSLTIGWKSNRSNDPVYDYSGTNISLGISIIN